LVSGLDRKTIARKEMDDKKVSLRVVGERGRRTGER
jgi:hypothetical protein